MFLCLDHNLPFLTINTTIVKTKELLKSQVCFSTIPVYASYSKPV